ncbi:unannotated protein [freshwater metagenome]|uniref:Unannotated protein n=1 Tax=freshwater metagenome TaxID=449393 RepID=A0A6J7LF18_9ZZZZ
MLIALEACASNGRKIDRRRQVPNNSVEQRLNALVLERSAIQNGNDFARNRCLTNSSTKFVDGNFFFRNELLEKGFVDAGNSFNKVGAICLGVVLHVCGDLLDLPIGAKFFVEPHECLHRDEVDNALVVTFSTDRKLQHRGVGFKTIFDGVESGVEVGAKTVHLVDETDSRNVVLIGLTPHRFGLRFHTSNSVEHCDGAIEHAK